MKTGPLAGIILLALTIPAHAQWHGGHGWHGGWHPEGHGWGPGAFWGGVVGGTIGALLRPQAPPAPPQWPAYCYNYRSFNPQTGYWIDYSGVPHFCQ